MQPWYHLITHQDTNQQGARARGHEEAVVWHLTCAMLLQESIRGCDVFLIQPSCPPVNDSLMELLITIDACKRASARSITAVMPYFGYARADRKTQGRESIAAKLTANLLTEAGEPVFQPLAAAHTQLMSYIGRLRWQNSF